MRKHNLYVIPRSDAECNQLASLVNILGATSDSVGSTFKVGQVALFWQPTHYTARLISSINDMAIASCIKQVSVNELSQRLRG